MHAVQGIQAHSGHGLLQHPRSSGQSVTNSIAAQLAAVTASSPQLAAGLATTNPYLLLTLAAQQQQQQQQLAATAIAIQQQLAALSATQATVDPSSLALASGLTSPSTLLTTGLPLHFGTSSGTSSSSGGSASSPSSGVSCGSSSASLSSSVGASSSPNGHLSSQSMNPATGLYYPASSSSHRNYVSASSLRNANSRPNHSAAFLASMTNSMSATTSKQLFGGLTTHGINSHAFSNNRNDLFHYFFFYLPDYSAVFHMLLLSHLAWHTQPLPAFIVDVLVRQSDISLSLSLFSFSQQEFAPNNNILLRIPLPQDNKKDLREPIFSFTTCQVYRQSLMSLPWQQRSLCNLSNDSSFPNKTNMNSRVRRLWSGFDLQSFRKCHLQQSLHWQEHKSEQVLWWVCCWQLIWRSTSVLSFRVFLYKLLLALVSSGMSCNQVLLVLIFLLSLILRICLIWQPSISSGSHFFHEWLPNRKQEA